MQSSLQMLYNSISCVLFGSASERWQNRTNSLNNKWCRRTVIQRSSDIDPRLLRSVSVFIRKYRKWVHPENYWSLRKLSSTLLRRCEYFNCRSNSTSLMEIVPSASTCPPQADILGGFRKYFKPKTHSRMHLEACFQCKAVFKSSKFLPAALSNTDMSN